MPSGNKIILYGHVGRDPELKYNSKGTAFCTFSVPSDDKRKDKNGDLQTTTTWFRVTAFGQTAEACGKYLKKGQLVMVDGRLRQEEYTDKDGNKRTTLEIAANDVVFLGKSADSAAPPPAAPSSKPTAPAEGIMDDGDVPF